MKAIPPAFFRQLLVDAQLSERDARERAGRALDAGYWRGLAADDSSLPASPHAPVVVENALVNFRGVGVYRMDGAVAPAALSRLNAIVDRVMADGWPPVFAFAYDALWECARMDPIRSFVEGALGPGAKQIPHIWTHVVKAGGGHTGWSPHVDGPGGDRLTAWVALSDAGLHNGCMYAVPRSAEVDAAVGAWSTQDTLSKDHVSALLQSARAMPARAGDVLGWGFNIVHWGSGVAPNAPGRRSLSFEYIAAGGSPGPSDTPLAPLDGPLPPLRDRLRAIGAALLEYKKFEPLALRYEGVARALVADDATSTIHGS